MSDSTDLTLHRQLVEHFAAALDETVAAIRKELAEGKRPIGKGNEPRISYHDNGMPHLSDGSYFDHRGPLQYVDLLKRATDTTNPLFEPKFEQGRFSCVDALVDFIESNPNCAKSYQQINNTPEVSLTRILVELQLVHALNRFFQRYGDIAFAIDKHKPLLDPIFRGFFNERLDVTTVIPIALVKFDFARIRLAQDAYIFRMSEDLQKKRWSVKAYGANGHDGVVSAATHAFAITGWSWLNQPWFQMVQNLGAYTPALRDKVEELFAALRLVTGVSTGYAQELRLARGWTHLHTDQPPEVHAAGARRYPEEFDNFAWLRDDIPTISGDHMREIALVLGKMRSIENDRLVLALRRMNGALIRGEVADAILDATIALEILLSDGDSQSISYKLQMRAAALANLDTKGTGQAIRDDIKEIYDARSRIVHGGVRSRHKGAKTNTDQEMRDLSVTTLRKIIRVVLNNPKYLDPKKIDADLLIS